MDFVKPEVINQYVKAYRSLIEHPTLTYAEVLSSGSNSDLIKILTRWSQRNIEKGELSKFQKFHLLKTSSSEVVFESTPVDISLQQFSKFSSSENFQCIIKETKQENKKKQFLEIWSPKGLFKNFDVSAFDVHGDIYCDVEFGSLEWSPNEDKLIYVAEKKPDKSEPFYKQKPVKENKNDEKEPNLGGEYVYKQDWGEQLVGKHLSIIGICDLKDETLKVLEGVPKNFSVGQLLWSKDGTGIYGTAFETEPRRLGLIYCSSRISYIFYLTLNGAFKILSDKNKAVCSPRLSPDGKSLFWLQRPAAGAHGGCLELVKLDLTTNKQQVLIDIVKSGNKTFSGLYMHNLPVRCFSKDGTKIFFSSLNRNKSVTYYFDLGTKEIHSLETGEGSAAILDVHNDMILISVGSLQQPSCLKMSKSITKIEWIPITKSDKVIKDSVVKEMDFESKAPNQKFTYYNALYYGPSPPATSDKKVPLIVFPHGGPHSAFTNDFSLECNFFVSIGYGVLMVNYRGSTGVGQDGIDFLLGKVSDTDVKDNQEAVTHVLKTIPYLDPKNVFLYGKSHGGYLVGHLSSQYPDFYRAVVSLNGVTDVYAMYIMSDIPDWASSESGFNFDESKPMTLEEVDKMIKVSPLHLADKIKAPTLFLLGKNDLRVPYHGGLKLYQALKARNVKVGCNVYEDNHTLGSVPNHIDCTINSAIWFFENKA